MKCNIVAATAVVWNTNVPFLYAVFYFYFYFYFFPAAIFSLILFIYIFNFYLHTFAAIGFTAEWAVDFYVQRARERSIVHTRLQNRKFESISSGSDDAERKKDGKIFPLNAHTA